MATVTSTCSRRTGGDFHRLHLNLLRQLDSPFLLRPGLPWQLDVYARYGPPRWVDVALPFVSLAPTHVPLGVFGTVGIDPTVMVALSPLVIPQPAGVGTLSVPTPNLPALAGIALHAQAILIQHPTQDRLTNALTDVFVR